MGIVMCPVHHAAPIQEQVVILFDRPGIGGSGAHHQVNDHR
jgi:hypothetical protein